MISTGVTEINFAMLNNGIIPVGNIEGSVRTDFNINGTEGCVACPDQVRCLPGDIPTTAFTNHKPIHPVTTEIIGDQVALSLLRKMTGIHHCQPALLGLPRVETPQNFLRVARAIKWYNKTFSKQKGIQ